MRTLYATLLTVLGGMSASAQVVFELPTALPPIGIIEREWWYADPITFTTSGTNVTWDFSTALTDAGMTYDVTVEAPSNTPFAATFPTSTHATGIAFIPGDTIWTYYRLSADSLHYLGEQGTPFTTVCIDERTRAVFPFSYGQLVEDSSSCGPPGTPYPAFSGYELVATGTMITPVGTLPDVALLRLHANGQPSASYEFYQYGNILAHFGQYDDGSLTLWPPTSGVGITENGAGASVLNAYPNPSKDAVFVEVGDRTEFIPFTLFDDAGRTLNSGVVNTIGGRVRLDVSDLSRGNYVLRLATDGTSAYARVSVVR